MYQGSMVGSGACVYAVWGYCIANAEAEAHTVDLNPKLLSTIIGESEEKISDAIAFLSSPDPQSHNEDYEGRRLVKTSGLEYFLPSHEYYRGITNSEDLRVYFREQKRKQREKDKSDNVLDCLGQSQDPVSVSASDSISLSGDRESERKRVKSPKTETEKKRARVDAVNPLQIRVASWFGRKESTKWTVYEVGAWQEVNPSLEEINDLELFYEFDHPTNADFRRRKLEQLLNNWASEVDKARAFIAQKNKQEEEKKRSEKNEW